ncbi:hypothetical protein INT43_006189 [Umbelopsis isabellina]|uniref:Uncharacterized protein n=1 Tax=Mortierella isabellina TaxID=91625 RepID=A0A8H7PYT3_MORIS|nr:hypothetical protein INT43_006189 [Umbelopsis isabellina]
MLQEHDNQFEDIDFDSPQNSVFAATHAPRTDILYHHDEHSHDIQRARKRRSNTQEQQDELLRYIAAKEKIIFDLHDQLQGHQADLKLLKENWTRIVTQCSRSSTPESSPILAPQSKASETQAVPSLDMKLVKGTTAAHGITSHGTGNGSQSILDRRSGVNPKSINRPSNINTNAPPMEQSPLSPYDGISQGLASAYQNFRDTLENVAPAERISYQAMTALRSAMQKTYQVMSAPIIEEDNQTDMDYFSAIPITGPSVFGRSPFFVPSPRSQGSPKSVAPALPPKLKKSEHARSMTIG